ncbi:MerR family transcriptional regulator [Shouchella clausii]|uniref:MerR family transcriptional regulator n=1 Tax=Shouchella TaxID=2893057 RepID=UPI000BA6ED78|nr:MULTISPECIES: MerR family transcriptional regulator [Shouchella]MCM3381220.1 VOC family protein [Shouchella rhizosphaerae]PAE80398.1 MerR family transcriptional regulator [Shouchella clausii]
MFHGVEFDFVVKDSKAALEQYKAIFDVEVVEETNFKVGNNEAVFNIYGTRFHMLDENHEYQLFAPKEGDTQSFWFNIVVPDIKETYAKAIAANTKEIQPVTRIEKMGVSNAMFSDSNGYVWMLHEIHREVSFEERVDILSEDFE